VISEPLVYKGAGSDACPVTFDPLAHEYRMKGQWRPGATRILSDNGYSGKGAKYFTDESRRRGRAVHHATRLIDENCPEASTMEEVLDVMDMDERLHGYVRGYLLWKKEAEFTPIYHEILVYSMRLNCCGHFDVYGRTPRGTRLVDLKTWKGQGPTVKRGAALQAAGYKLMLRECLGIETDMAEILALPGDGKFREFPSTNPLDEGVFSSNCVVWWDRKTAGILENGAESEVEMTE
jgi:hypothetical protein